MSQLRSLASIALAGALIQGAGQVNASVFETAKIQRIIEGREVYIDRKEAKTNQTAIKGQQISTGSSRSELLFDRKAIGFLGRNSLITLGQSCFRLKEGSVLINGNQQSCLGSKVLGVRGTTYVLSRNANGNYDLAVLHGQASVEASSSSQTTITPDILDTYPKLNPVVSFGSSLGKQHEWIEPWRSRWFGPWRFGLLCPHQAGAWTSSLQLQHRLKQL